MITIEENLRSANETFDRYWKYTRKTRGEALQKIASNVCSFSIQELKATTAKKGDITAERMAALKSGEGIKVSERAKELVGKKFGIVENGGRKWMTGGGKRGFSKAQRARVDALNQKFRGQQTIHQLYIEKEIQLREGHRSFSESSMVFPGFRKPYARAGDKTYSTTSGGERTGAAELVSTSLDAEEMRLDWGSAVGKWSKNAAAGLNSAAGKKAIARGLARTRSDMLTYIARKQNEAARAAARMVKGV